MTTHTIIDVASTSGSVGSEIQTLVSLATAGYVLTSNGTSTAASFQAVSASGAVTSITGNSGGAQSPSSGNFNLLGSGSITAVGTANTETIQLTGLTNHAVLVGAGTDTITNVGPGSSGQILQSGGASADPAYSTATYPSTAGTTGNVLTSDGTNWISSPSSGGGIGTINGDSGSATGSTITLKAGFATHANGTLNFAASGSTILLDVEDGNSNTGIGTSVFLGGASGGNNCGFGNASSQNLTSGTQNSSFGIQSLLSNQTGSYNIAIGTNALVFLNGGSSNTCIGVTNTGHGSGQSYTSTESSNICISNVGVLGESNVMRIGTQGTGDGQQNTCFIAGITGATVTGAAVLCSSSGQLGTIASSLRYKENVKDIGDSSALLNLRPVEFNYKADKSGGKAFGLIAEEVEKVFPRLVVYDDFGQPNSVKYHEMPALLLNEIIKLRKEINELKASKQK